MFASKPALESPEPIAAPTPDPTHEELQMRSYEIWQMRIRHGIEGTAAQDWAHAEHELTKSNSDSSTKEKAGNV